MPSTLFKLLGLTTHAREQRENFTTEALAWAIRGDPGPFLSLAVWRAHEVPVDRGIREVRTQERLDSFQSGEQAKNWLMARLADLEQAGVLKSLDWLNKRSHIAELG